MANLTLRTQLGRALTFRELDSNFLALDSDITNLTSTLSGSYVTLNTVQTITGAKTFSDTLTASNGVILNSLTYPTVDGTGGQFLKTDGAGNLSFDTVTSYDSAKVQGQIDSAAVKLTTDQTIAGVKTFQDSVAVNTQLVIAPDATAVTPLAALHVFMDGTTYNNPTFEKAQDNSGGIALAQKRSRGTLASQTALQKDDVVGGFTGQGYDGSNYQFAAAIRYKVDSAVAAGVVPMRITFETSETNSPVERLVVKSNGKIGIGAPDPTALLDIRDTGNMSVALDGTSGTGTQSLRFRSNGITGARVASEAANRNLLFFTGGGNLRMRIDSDGDIVAFNQLQSTVTTGTAPFTVASTTLVTNLNADLLDGQQGSHYRIDVYDASGTLLN